MEYLVDTNVISELVRPRPHEGALRWYAQNQDATWICSLTVQELVFGVELLPDGKRKEKLRRDIGMLLDWYVGKIIAYSDAEARACGRMLAAARRDGNNCDSEDVMIAATAAEHGLVVATRNLKHFAPLGVEAMDPFAV